MWTCASRQEYVRVKSRGVFKILPRTFLNISDISYTFYDVIYNDKKLVRNLTCAYFPHHWQDCV